MSNETVTTILVVDDNPAGRYATSHILKSVGWVVLEAATGAKALDIISRENVDLVVLDVNLPDIDGFEVCRQIRSKERISRVPVVHLSATFVSDHDKIYGLEMGADGYLVHPVEPPVLVATVRAFLRARRAEVDLERLLVSERAAREEAERANQTKDDFLATLSHELRTPLHVIIGWAQLLKMGMLSSQDVSEAIEVIEKSAYSQAQMIADLLDISRISTGKIRLDLQPVNITEIVRTVATGMRPNAKAKGIRIEKSLKSSHQLVMGDTSRLQQVVSNLINNAIKFTPEGGTIQVTLDTENSKTRIVVADDGKGIDADLLPHIFDRFHQGDSSTTRDQGGLGLGLTIVKQLVELHGGEVFAESRGQDMGASFTILLPEAPEVTLEQTTKVLPAGTKLEDVPFKGVRILIVDDDAYARKMLVHILNRCQAVTQSCQNVQEAIAEIPLFHPHILLSDIGMPIHDGYELIRQIRSLGYSSEELPAIALTAFAHSEDRDRAISAGFQTHLTKPIDAYDLVAKILDLLNIPI